MRSIIGRGVMCGFLFVCLLYCWNFIVCCGDGGGGAKTYNRKWTFMAFD